MISSSLRLANSTLGFALGFIVKFRVIIVSSLESKLLDSDELDDSRGAEEESELCSVLIYFITGRLARSVLY